MQVSHNAGARQTEREVPECPQKELYFKHIEEIENFQDVSPSYLLRGIQNLPEDGTDTGVKDEMLCVSKTKFEKAGMHDTSSTNAIVRAT